MLVILEDKLVVKKMTTPVVVVIVLCSVAYSSQDIHITISSHDS